MTTILYYVSSHGYGHAVRSAQVITELTRNKGVRVVVRTAAPAWLFPATRDGSVIVEPADVDEGLVQADSMTVDMLATLKSFRSRMESLRRDTARELEAVRRWNPSVIVSDIAPLGVETGWEASIPTVVVANFLWDWILLDYAKKEPEFSSIASRLNDTYQKATRILRTPLSGGFEGYGAIADIPLIARTHSKTREQARRDLGLHDDSFLALVSLGGLRLDRFFRNLDKRVSVCDLMIPGENRKSAGRIRWFDSLKTDHADLLAACDAVIGKMGYGLCSELIANKRPLLYTLRNDFIEFKVLKEETMKYVGVVEAPEDEFFNGSLDEYLEILRHTSHPSASLPVDGARVAADAIMDIAAGNL